MTYKSFIFYSCNAKLVLYNINYLIHAFLKYPKFVIFNLSVYEINPFRKFFKEDTGFCRCCGRLISSALMPTHCHVALATRVKTHKLLQICKQVVTSLFTSCQHVVFALLAPSLLWQVWNKLLTNCNKLDGIIRPRLHGAGSARSRYQIELLSRRVLLLNLW